MPTLEEIQEARAAKLHDVIHRITTDSEFAARLKQKAAQAAREGVATDNWGEFMQYFAADADELARLTTPEVKVRGIAVGTTVTTFLTTLHTGSTETTTTVLTLSLTCHRQRRQTRTATLKARATKSIPKKRK